MSKFRSASDGLNEYISELYNDENREEKPVYEGNIGPPFLKAEVINARRKMKDKKAPGADGIDMECIKALDGVSLDLLTDLCNKIYTTRYKLEDCSVMSHVMKLILRMIIERVDSKIENEISDNQSGYRPGKGTCEGIFNLRNIIERYLEVQKTVYISFMDYAKASDTVYHEGIMDCLDMIEMEENDKRLIENFYWEQTDALRLECDLSASFSIKKGVRQGCGLSPKLFNLYTKRIFRESDGLSGCLFGGNNIDNLRYADDTLYQLKVRRICRL